MLGVLKRFSPFFLLFLSLCLVGLSNTIAIPVAQAEENFIFERGSLELRLKEKDDPLVFSIEKAQTPAQHRKGLMFRSGMPSDHGMLFIFEREAPLSFWMKNTFLPLDIIFINSEGVIVHISRNATPFSTKLIPSLRPASFVLEINAGLSDEKGIKVGDYVTNITDFK